MLISLNKIKEYVRIDLSTDELIKLIGSRLVEVEGSTNLSEKYQGIRIAKVISCEPIPETHLHLCKIAGGENEWQDQETGLTQVVCGAPNVHAGMLAAWIMPGSIVPSTFGGENFRLSVRKLRGYDSHGMLAAADELDLGTDHEGIIEIDPKMPVSGPLDAVRPVEAGDDFATVFDLNDTILDIENKSLTHRPDCFGLIGFAREVAGILGQKFEEPTLGAEYNISDVIDIEIENPAICPRYSCAVLDCEKLLAPSKYFTKQAAFLAKSGMRLISPIVDLTNVLMLETGQPLHAFDYDKFVKVGACDSPKVIVRLARAGEKLQLLDGKTIECVPTDILITSNDTPVALAGAMGGANTEIDASSRKIILESATFSLYNLRKTQMAHGIFSEAITRFTKGQPASQTLLVLSEALRRLGGEPISISDYYPEPTQQIVVKITTKEINDLLGTDYDNNIVKSTLQNVGFSIKGDTELEVIPPSWRTDIHIKEDVIEEVGRLLGFDNIALALPTKTFCGTLLQPMWKLKTELRDILSGELGLHELLTYSFVSGDLLNKVGEDARNSYRIINSISPELQYFRQTITPSLLDKVYENLRSGHENFGLYEINQVVNKAEEYGPDATPNTHMHLSVLEFGDFYQIKKVAEFLADRLHINLTLTEFNAGPAYFEPKHSAATELGSFGEIRKSVLRQFKLENYQICALEWDIAPILSMPRGLADLSQLTMSKYPSVSRDLTLSTPSNVEYGKLDIMLKTALDAEGLIYKIKPISIYQATPDSSTRNISFHLEFASPNRTLTSEEISDIMERITNKITALGVEAV